MTLKIYVTKAGEPVSQGVASIYGIESGVTSGVNLVGFVIEGGVIEPKELKEVDEMARDLSSKLDTTKPVIISGRGPHWLYAVLVHNLHFASVLATWEPRVKKGRIVEAPTKELLGKAIDISGSISDISLGANPSATVKVVYRELQDKNLLHLEVVGDKFVEPSVLRRLELPDVNPAKPLIIEGAIPIWLGQAVAAHYLHRVPAVAFYDPRLGGGVVAATHTSDVGVGELIPLTQEEVQKALAKRQTKVVGILGDPNSGKSVFLHLLNDELRRMGLVTLTQEADLTAPTQHWSLFAPEIRKELKKVMSPEERLQWTVNSLRQARESGTVDIVLADIGGGRPDLGQRVTRENMAILQYVDGVVIVSRNDRNNIEAWLRELKTYLPHMKVYAVLESVLEGEATVKGMYGIVTHLDRALYAENRVPEKTRHVAREVAKRILEDQHRRAEEIDVDAVSKKLQELKEEQQSKHVSQAVRSG